MSEPAQRDAVPRQHDGVELQVVADPSRSRSSSSIGRSASSAVVERQARRRRRRARDARSARSRRRRGAVENARPTIAGAHRRRPVGQDAQREAPAGSQPRRPARCTPSARVDDRGSLRDGVGGRRVLHDQRAEAELVEELEAALARAAAVAQRVDVELDRHVGADPQQLAALPRLGRRAPAAPSRYRFCGTSAACSSRCRASRRSTISSRAPFSPMPGTPLMLSIVSPISASTSTTCSGVTPNFSFTPAASYQVPSSRGLKTRMPSRDELKEVLVAGDDRDVEAGRRRLLGHRADHIVGFVALGGEDRHAERLAGARAPAESAAASSSGIGARLAL